MIARAGRQTCELNSKSKISRYRGKVDSIVQSPLQVHNLSEASNQAKEEPWEAWGEGPRGQMPKSSIINLVIRDWIKA